jgi:hypothetical protein
VRHLGNGRGQRVRIGGVAREDLDGDRVALARAQQAEDDLPLALLLVPGVTELGQGTMPALEVRGTDVVQQQGTLDPVARGQPGFDPRLPPQQPVQRLCHTGRSQSKSEQDGTRAELSRRLRAHDCRDLAPRLKAILHGGAVLRRREEVTARTEQIADATEQREKVLRRVWRSEALHLTLSQTGGKMRLLHAVVHPSGRSHSQVLDTMEFRQARQRRPIAGQESVPNRGLDCYAVETNDALRDTWATGIPD